MHLRDSTEPPLPIQALIRPLKKKFRVYFYAASSKLNDPSKPEYYLSVVLRWIKDNQKFVDLNFEELFADYSAIFEFAGAVVRLAGEKVKSDLKQIEDDDIFSHLIDEVLSHDADLLAVEPGLREAQRPIMVIENDENILQRWLRLEISAARER